MPSTPILSVDYRAPMRWGKTYLTSFDTVQNDCTYAEKHSLELVIISLILSLSTALVANSLYMVGALNKQD